MTAPQKYWITDGADNYGVVEGAAERDRWVADGWTEVDEPVEATAGQVFMWHEDAERPGRATPGALRALWSHRGWVAGPPPGAGHPLIAAELADQPEQSADGKAAKAAPKTTSKSAAGGTEKGVIDA